MYSNLYTCTCIFRYCAEHARTTAVSRQKSTRKRQPSESAETLLECIDHYKYNDVTKSRPKLYTDSTCSKVLGKLDITCKVSQLFFRRHRYSFAFYPLTLKTLFHGNASHLIVILFPNWHNLVAFEKTVPKMCAMCYFPNEM